MVVILTTPGRNEAQAALSSYAQVDLITRQKVIASLATKNYPQSIFRKQLKLQVQLLGVFNNE